MTQRTRFYSNITHKKLPDASEGIRSAYTQIEFTGVKPHQKLIPFLISTIQTKGGGSPFSSAF